MCSSDLSESLPETSGTGTSENNDSEEGGLPLGAVIGIIAGVVIVAAGVLVYVFVIRKKSEPQNGKE